MRMRLISNQVLVAIAALLGVTADAQAARAQVAPAEAVTGTLIVAHGGSREWNARVRAVAGEVRSSGPIGVSFLMGLEAAATRFQDVVRELVAGGAMRIVVVPLLVSSRSGHYEQIRYLAGEIDELDPMGRHDLEMAGIERHSWPVPLRVASALDDAPELAEVLADRALAAAESRRGGLFLVAHGPNSPEEEAFWMEKLRAVAESVRVRTGFRSVLVGLLRDDAPAPVRAEAVRRIRELIQLQHEATGGPVVVLPTLTSAGVITEVKVPADLASLPIISRGDPLLPHPAIARWVEARLHEAWAYREAKGAQKRT